MELVSLKWFLILILVACGSGASEQVGEPAAQNSASQSKSKKKPQAEWYDSEGKLKESDKTLAGLRLPVALTLSRETDRRHVYRTPAPLEKVQAYFGRRLLTAVVERKGKGAIFRSAKAKGAKGATVLLDVSVLPTSSRQTRVDIYEIPPPPKKPLGEHQIRKLLQDELKHMQ